MKKTTYVKSVVLLMILLGLVSFTGCGKKGLPQPPINKAGLIASPYDLKLKKTGQEIRLIWKHQIDEKTAAVKPEAFEIFMAKKSFDQCEGCPFKFTLAGKVDASVLEFFVPVKEGFKYYFRIQATDDDKLRSSYSKTIQLEYK